VGLYEGLSAYKNLDFYGRLYKCSEQERRERIEYFLKMLELWDKRDEAVGAFSKGMKQKLAIARALIHDPQVLFLDEPTANLDPEASKTVRDFILELKKEKRTIFLNTHMLDEAERICDRVAILKTKLSGMDFETAWTVAKKDFNLLRTKKNIMYTLVALPLGMGVGLPALVWLIAIRNATISFVDLFPVFNAFNFWFIIVASAVPAGMSSYSIVGEKVEKSLEPLLATPATDGEILLGKSLASFLPSIGATYLGAVVFMVLIDVITGPQLGYLFYPNWMLGFSCFWLYLLHASSASS
jgi:energy-coupling factor transporter ATP-binding protein EcfA2